MADTNKLADYSIVKLTAAFTAGTNVPGLLRPYTGPGTGRDKDGSPIDVECGLDMAGGTAGVMLTHNGLPKIGGAASGAGIDYYPGDDITNGDVKFAFDLASGDILVARYGNIQLREIGS
jgi:hypothetical protein